MKQVDLPQIDELNGYLKCLARLSLKRCFYGSLVYETELEIDEFCGKLAVTWSEGDEYVSPTNHSFLGSSVISSESLFSEIEKIILRGALNNKSLANAEIAEYLRKMLAEDINEYFGLLSSSLEVEGEFHPLLSGGVFRIEFECSKHSDSFYFIKKIGKYYVLIYFYQIAES